MEEPREIVALGWILKKTGDGAEVYGFCRDAHLEVRKKWAKAKARDTLSLYAK